MRKRFIVKIVTSLHPDVESEGRDHEVESKRRLVLIFGRDALEVVFLQREIEHAQVLLEAIWVGRLWDD